MTVTDVFIPDHMIEKIKGDSDLAEWNVVVADLLVQRARKYRVAIRYGRMAHRKYGASQKYRTLAALEELTHPIDDTLESMGIHRGPWTIH